MIRLVARFGENLRKMRDALGLRQEDLAPKLRKRRGGPMGQAGLSKLERLEFSPSPETVTRLAMHLAPLLGLPIETVYNHLIDGVPTEHDAARAALAAAVAPAPRDSIGRFLADVARLPTEEQRAELYAAMELIANGLPANRHSDLLDAVKQEAAKTKPRSARKKA